MTVIFNRTPCTLPDGVTVSDAVGLLSPYGDEPVIVLHNGVAADGDAHVCDGDTLAVFPRLIGG